LFPAGGYKMNLSWDTIGGYVLLASIFAIVLGFSKAFLTIIAVEIHLKKSKNKSIEYRLKRKEAVSSTLFEGLVELLAGACILAVFSFPGILNEEGRSIVTILGIFFLALTFIFWEVANYYLKELGTISSSEKSE
jgi:uncharacterized membrane protein